jgi:hypothetical protein
MKYVCCPDIYCVNKVTSINNIFCGSNQLAFSAGIPISPHVSIITTSSAITTQMKSKSENSNYKEGFDVC